MQCPCNGTPNLRLRAPKDYVKTGVTLIDEKARVPAIPVLARYGYSELSVEQLF